MSIKYLNGQTNFCEPFNRTFTVNLYCKNHAFSEPSVAPVIEYAKCEYSIKIDSIYSCPTTCGINTLDLCTDNGICAFDSDLKYARCICNTGFSGKICDVIGVKNYNSTSIILIVVACFLALLQIVMYSDIN